ncbi:lipopolysaccharide export system permease protein [Andreprevotia lacus DSM 23236]|jgi:lipopolysaccharide export system permease protein|uniref:Lipopolysaccharide export system permease protein LptF n=1 Tax=Andreprevotia lacus DSM 23236 TaxID=1121001 RepID=A0A1W1Y0C0_9NEIS|nr:LPS export ABC transporter permease LptF [Andreprevotia lacus]SMC29577.1 lipopolysaccharide export system permease protein [Andreprevotia lacus DSM 23236]
MLFRKSLIHELSWMAIAVFSVLLLMVLTTQVVKLMGQASVGALASSAVWALMGFAAIRYLPVLMSLMLFLSILAVLTRMWRDHEMVIWFASGQSIRNFIRPILEFAIPVVLLIAALSLYGWPWALSKGDEFRERSLARQETTQVSPGVFRESAGADRVYFVEDFTGEHTTGQNVFVQLKQGDQVSVVLAQRGGLVLDGNGERWLSLGNGRIYRGTPGLPNFETVQFEQARLRIDTPDRPISSPSTRASPTMKLLGSKDPEQQAEVAWRIAIPVSALILSLMAIPLAFFNPRGGRSLNLLYAIVLYFLYYNCININQAWIADGRTPAWLGMWPLHAVAAAMTVALFAWRGRVRAA